MRIPAGTFPMGNLGEMGTSSISEAACVLIPAGEFLMGCEAGRDEERPVHRIYLDAFEMAALQVRNHDFAMFVEMTGHPIPLQWNDPNFAHPDQPVVAVNWFEAVKYCDWLSNITGRRFRLPTEAEWEWAVRGGQEGFLYTWGKEPPNVRDAYNRRWRGRIEGPLPVGQGLPNPFGLYDMSENVHEWCIDWFDRDYYAQSPDRNPQGPETGDRRVSRGGSWRHQIKVSRCAARSSLPPSFHYSDYGFRVVRDMVGSRGR